MKGDICEYLHEFDLDRMPECRWGVECDLAGCPFRHIDEEDKVECVFFQQGLCIHGPHCRYKHIKSGPEDKPEMADFELQLGAGKKRGSSQPNE
jgi:cleavage and polyadenylation specificity factor subunit 4